MDKVVIIQNKIPHYRIPIYNELAKHYDTTLVHSSKNKIKDNSFKSIRIDSRRIGFFEIQKNLFKTIKKISPDFIIIMFDIRWIMSFILLFRTDIKIIWWGLDEGKSSNWLLKKIALRIKLIFTRLGYPIIFYHETIKEKFIKLGVKNDICFVANNTFHIEKRIKSFLFDKRHLLFVGTLNSRKKIDICIEAFSKVNSSIKNKMNFIIIGDGEEKDFLNQKIIECGQSEYISLVGKINNTQELEEYYKNAIASISYGQAGLSVLQSFGYGVPFITKSNSISGGETYNIIDHYNGIIIDESLESLENVIKKINLDQKYAKILGENAYNYYTENCTSKNMVNGFIAAINKSKGI